MNGYSNAGYIAPEVKVMPVVERQIICTSASSPEKFRVDEVFYSDDDFEEDYQ